MRAWTDLCNRNGPVQMEKNMLSLDRSVQREMLYVRCYASLDDQTMQQEILLLSSGRFYPSLDRSVQQGTLLCSWKQFYASLNGPVRQLLCSLTNTVFEIVCHRT